MKSDSGQLAKTPALDLRLTTLAVMNGWTIAQAEKIAAFTALDEAMQDFVLVERWLEDRLHAEIREATREGRYTGTLAATLSVRRFRADVADRLYSLGLNLPALVNAPSIDRDTAPETIGVVKQPLYLYEVSQDSFDFEKQDE